MADAVLEFDYVLGRVEAEVGQEWADASGMLEEQGGTEIRREFELASFDRRLLPCLRKQSLRVVCAERKVQCWDRIEYV